MTCVIFKHLEHYYTCRLLIIFPTVKKKSKWRNFRFLLDMKIYPKCPTLLKLEWTRSTNAQLRVILTISY